MHSSPPIPFMPAAEIRISTNSSIRQLLPIEAVMAILDLGHERIEMMIERGDLAVAWDISSRGSSRREIRVWRACLPSAASGAERGVLLGGPGAEAAAVAAAFGARLELRTPELRNFMSISQSHLQSLINAGQLIGLNHPGPGPQGYVRVPAYSLVHFLSGRRIF
jgi:hypothetical protein